MNALHKYSNVVAGIALVVFAAAANCRANPPAAAALGAGAGGGAGGGAARELLNRLNSSNPAERDAAQKQAALILDVLANPETLQKLSEAAANEDLRNFLEDRVAKLKSRDEARRLSVLPPVSLKLKDASLQEVVDRLNRSLDVGLGFQPVIDPGFADRFNLDVTDKPFWEVFAALHQQHPLSLTGVNGPSAGMYVSTSTTKSTAYAIDGPAIALVNAINLQRSVGSASDGSARQATLSLDIMLAFDPRLEISRIQGPGLVNAVDDRGQTYPLATPRPGGLLPYISAEVPARANTYTLSVPAEMGKKLSFTLDASAELYVISSAATIADVEHNINKLVVVGNHTYRVSQFAPANVPATPVRRGASAPPGQFSITVVVGDAPGVSGTAAPGTLVKINPGQLVMRDATGKVVWRGMGGTTSKAPDAISSNITAATPPYKLEVRDIAGTVALPVRLQFKDVALP